MADRFIGNIELYRVLMATRVFRGSLNANTISDVRNWQNQDGEYNMTD